MSEHEASVSLKLVRGNPTEEELAAILAVLPLAYSAETQEAVALEEPHNAWRVSARGLRRPLQRDLGWARSGTVRF